MLYVIKKGYESGVIHDDLCSITTYLVKITVKVPASLSQVIRFYSIVALSQSVGLKPSVYAVDVAFGFAEENKPLFPYFLTRAFGPWPYVKSYK